MTVARFPLRSKCTLLCRLFVVGAAIWYLTMFLAVRTDESYTQRQANIAYFIQVSQDNVDMVPRLMRVLYHPRNIYAVHFDRKIPEAKIEPMMRLMKSAYGNVHFMDRELITYKGVTMLLNTIEAMHFLLDKSKNWDYFINLSGSDYPLVSPLNMRRLLGREGVADRSINFLQLSTDKGFWNEMKEHRFAYTHFDTALSFQDSKEPKLVPTWNNHPLKDELALEFVQAEAWMMLHRSACEFTVNSSYARKLLLLLSTAQDPEEHYFPMMMWNHPQLNRTLARHALRGVFWVHEGQKSGQHPYNVDEKDENGHWKFWERVQNSPYFFVRKMSTPHNPLMDMIDRTKSGNSPEARIEEVKLSFKRTRARFGCIADVDARRHESKIMSCFG